MTEEQQENIVLATAVFVAVALAALAWWLVQ
jgi:hypothetical protein